MFSEIDRTLYKKLCISSKKYLKKFNGNIILLSNPAFFIIRESSSEILDILELNKITLYINLASKIISLPIKLLINLFYSYKNKIKNKILISRDSGIFVCHKGNNPKSYTELNKLFLGIEYIKGNKYTFYKDSVYDHEIWNQNKNNLKNKDHTFVPPYMSFNDEINYSFKTLINSIKLLNIYFLSKDNIDRLILLNAIFHSISLNNLVALRIYNFIKKNTSKKNTKFILTTYEGYPWERLILFLGYELRVPRIAFMNAPISQYQFSTFNRINNKFDPDLIVFKSQRDLSLAKSKGMYKSSKLINIGFHKEKSIPDFDYKIRKSKFRNMNNTILLLPEESDSEINIFLEKVIDSLPKVDFSYILRLHPNTSIIKIKLLARKIKKINSKYNSTRIRISTASLINDINSSSIAIYRGSSAIIYALQNSKILPIFLESNSIMIDPLYYISNKIMRVKNLYELPKIINKNSDNLISPNLASHFDKFNSKLFVKAFSQFIYQYK